jgi:hypothetical protein
MVYNEYLQYLNENVKVTKIELDDGTNFKYYVEIQVNDKKISFGCDLRNFHNYQLYNIMYDTYNVKCDPDGMDESPQICLYHLITHVIENNYKKNHYYKIMRDEKMTYDNNENVDDNYDKCDDDLTCSQNDDKLKAMNTFISNMIQRTFSESSLISEKKNLIETIPVLSSQQSHGNSLQISSTVSSTNMEQIYKESGTLLKKCMKKFYKKCIIPIQNCMSNMYNHRNEIILGSIIIGHICALTHYKMKETVYVYSRHKPSYTYKY